MGYGPRCVPVMQLAEAAAGRVRPAVDDRRLPARDEPDGRPAEPFGPVVDISGLGRRADCQGPLGLRARRPSPPISMPAWSAYAEVAGGARTCRSTRRRRRPPSPTSPSNARSWLEAGLPMPACQVIRPDDSPSRSWPRSRLRGGLAGGSQAPVGPGQPLHLPGQRPPASWTGCSRHSGPSRPEMVLEGYLADDPARADDPYAAYVSVESVVAGGVISHLALTGRFPLAENFRETGFFIPAGSRRRRAGGGAGAGHRGHRGARGRAPAACTPRSSSPPTAPGSSRSTVGSAAACPRCSDAPPASPCSS